MAHCTLSGGLSSGESRGDGNKDDRDNSTLRKNSGTGGKGREGETKGG